MGHEEFSDKVEQGMRPILLRLLENGQVDFRLKADPGDADTPWPVLIRGHLSAQEDYVRRLHTITTEVIDSFQAMRDVEIYLSRLPFSRSGVTSSRYVHFQLEAFFNEMYILHQRMKAFTTRLAREFKHDPGAASIHARVQPVVRAVERLFKPLCDLRGSHVHSTRYDDAELRRLCLLELLASARPDVFRIHVRRASRTTRLNALEFVKSVNAGLATKLDTFFNLFTGLVFTKDGSIRIPMNLTAA